MTKQKKGFLLFLCSLIPGAGELYMGFRKMGLSIMGLFWGCIAVASFFSFDTIIFVLPILWFYSFFNTHNLKSLSEEEFHSLEDRLILPVDGLVKNKEEFIKQYRKGIAILLIIIGISGIWSVISNWAYNLLPDYVFEFVAPFIDKLPSLIIAIFMIVLGIRLIRGKQISLKKEEEEENRKELTNHENA